MSDDKIAYIEEVRCLRETDKALLCDVDGEEVWIPKSQIQDDSEVTEKGDMGILAIPAWLADEKGLDY